MPDTPHTNALSTPTPASACAIWLIGTLSVCIGVLMVLESPVLSGAFLGRATWEALVRSQGGVLLREDGEITGATLSLLSIAAPIVGVMLCLWLAGAGLIAWRAEHSFGTALSRWGTAGWVWWWLPGLWCLGWLVAAISDWTGGLFLLAGTVDLWWAVALAGWMTTGITLAARERADDPAPSHWSPATLGVIAAMLVYIVVFTTMNWQLWRGLWIPHGDSAMYEEHLWNLLHGKGFRSYLDQGLFLGEHLQVIHLALIPIYIFWPSHLLLELAESLALASTALPVFWIARRHTGSEHAALWLAVAALLYFPLQYLDIAIDFKTFRPIAFGVPLLMFALDQLERRRWASMNLLLLVAFSAKEDYAIVIAPLGVWMLLTGWRESRRNGHSAAPVDRRPLQNGTALAILATVYLYLAVKIVIPWFRGGGTVHYARYFSQFGETPTEIVTNMLTNPGLLWGQLVTGDSVLYALAILVPLGFLPLLSPSRLLVGAPLFVLLCLNELSHDPPAPMHHFHAPLVPIVFWAASAGLARVTRLRRFRTDTPAPSDRALTAARFACLCALCTGLTASLHPLSFKFWDPARSTYWRTLYIPGPRAGMFAKIEPLIPPTARVASTDFVHPRFTHHARSYDYSDYRRAVADYEHKVPDDTDFIVIDTMHPYSLQDHGKVLTPGDLPEVQSGQWDVLPDKTGGYFIVLKRKAPSAPP